MVQAELGAKRVRLNFEGSLPKNGRGRCDKRSRMSAGGCSCAQKWALVRLARTVGKSLTYLRCL